MVVSTGIQVGIYFLPVGVFIALVAAAALVLLLIPSLIVQLAVFSRQPARLDDGDTSVFAELDESKQA